MQGPESGSGFDLSKSSESPANIDSWSSWLCKGRPTTVPLAQTALPTMQALVLAFQGLRK